MCSYSALSEAWIVPSEYRKAVLYGHLKQADLVERGVSVTANHQILSVCGRITIRVESGHTRAVAHHVSLVNKHGVDLVGERVVCLNHRSLTTLLLDIFGSALVKHSAYHALQEHARIHHLQAEWANAESTRYAPQVQLYRVNYWTVKYSML